MGWELMNSAQKETKVLVFALRVKLSTKNFGMIYWRKNARTVSATSAFFKIDVHDKGCLNSRTFDMEIGNTSTNALTDFFLKNWSQVCACLRRKSSLYLIVGANFGLGSENRIDRCFEPNVIWTTIMLYCPT